MSPCVFSVHRLCRLLLLAVMMVSHAHALASDQLVIDGSTGVKPLIESLATGFMEKHARVKIEVRKGLKPDARVLALRNEKIDIAMASHGIDRQQLSQHNLTVHRFAKTAVVMGVNHSVVVGSLSHRQLCDIYNGRIVNWQQLGASPGDITPLIRPHNEVDTEVVSAHISCFSNLQIAPTIKEMKKSGEMASAIALTPGSIGMTTQVRVSQSKGKIIPLAINNIAPEPAHLESGDYPLTRDMFLITAANPNKHVLAFLTFIRSEYGSHIILANDAVPAD